MGNKRSNTKTLKAMAGEIAHLNNMLDGKTKSCEILKDKLVEAKKRAMPEGIEWPKFEDGELVKPGSSIVGDDGKTHTVEQIAFTKALYKLMNSAKSDSCLDIKSWNFQSIRVKRPAPQVLAADGLPIKVGETVYDADGVAFVVDDLSGLGNTIHLTCIKSDVRFNLLPSELTHTQLDTQERIDEDIDLPSVDYCKKYNLQYTNQFPFGGYTSGWEKSLDLLRRQRELDAKTMGGDAS